MLKGESRARAITALRLWLAHRAWPVLGLALYVAGGVVLYLIGYWEGTATAAPYRTELIEARRQAARAHAAEVRVRALSGEYDYMAAALSSLRQRVRECEDREHDDTAVVLESIAMPPRRRARVP